MSQMPNVSSKYGAPMGRDQGDSQVPGRWVRLFRVRINKGGYDDGGAYWGIGQPLYCATDDQYYTQYVRALDRQSAAHKLELRLKQHLRGLGQLPPDLGMDETVAIAWAIKV